MRISQAAAGEGCAAMAGDVDLASAGARAEDAVLGYTGLIASEPLPRPEWVSRREWAAVNVDSMRELIAPVEKRLASSLPELGRSALAAIAGRALAIEIGALVGFASRRVLGQYEFSMTKRERPPRLLFVGPNIDVACRQLGGNPADVLEWVALHEVTHAAHFGSAPWLREHLGSLSRELLAGTTMEVSPSELRERARRLFAGDPRRTVAELRASDPVTLLAPAAAQATISEVQATMAAIEGYAEHVMDAAAGDLGPVVPKLRTAIEHRRQTRSPLLRLISWLLGFEMKLRQYREGKRWADDVAERVGIDGLNGAWSGPDSLPTQPELADPDAWIDRVESLRLESV